MRNKTQFFKRVTALLLSLIMMLAPTVNAIAAVVNSQDPLQSQQSLQNGSNIEDGKWHGTTGELINANYDLSDAEKAILACSGLIGETFAVEIPTDEKNSDLVSVDAENETVTALPYAVNGQVWTPTKAVLKYSVDGSDGTDIDVPLSKSGDKYVGSFRKPANSYRVEVTYSLLITIESAVQRLLLDIPYYLVDGYEKINEAYSIFSMALEPFEEKIDELRALYDGVKYEIMQDGEVVYTYTIGLKDGSKVKEALGNLLNDFDSNGNHFSLAKDCDDYQAAASKVRFMLERGAAMKEHIEFFSAQIIAINENSQELYDFVAELKTLVNGPENPDDDVTTIADAKVMMKEEAEKLIGDTLVELFVNNDVEIDATAIKNLIVEKWPEKINELVEDIFAIVEDAINDTVDAELTANKQTIEDRYYEEVDVKIEEGIQIAIAQADEMIEKLGTEYAALIAQYQINLNELSLDSLSGKTRTSTPTYKQELAKIKTQYEQTFAPLDLLFIFSPGAYPEFEQQIKDAKAALVTLEEELDAAYQLADDSLPDVMATLKEEAILAAWRVVADDDEGTMSLQEAQNAFKKTVGDQFNNAKTLLEEKEAELDAMGVTALEKAAQIEALIDGNSTGFSLEEIAGQVEIINKKTWHYLAYKDSIVKDGISADEYKALDEAVFDGVGIIEMKPTVEIKPQLLAHETVLNGLVAQQVVSVEVKAQVVPATSVDSAVLVPLDVFSTSFAMDTDSSADSVLTKIADSGIENSALSQWDAFYNVGKTFYDRSVTVLDKDGADLGALGALTQDIRYVITYTPKTMTITESYKSAGQNETPVPYGYNFTLPVPTEAGKSYDYKVNGISQREGTVYRVVENINVERKLGKAVVGKSLSEIIALSLIPGNVLSEKEMNVLNSGAFYVDTLYYRTPDSNDKLTKVTADGTGYKLEAETMAAGLLNSDAMWIPVKAYPVFANGNGAEFALTLDGEKYVGTFNATEEFTKVQVVYQLTIDNVEESVVSAFANIAAVLVNDTKKQAEAMNSFFTSTPGTPVFYNNLAQLTTTILGSVSSVVELTPAAQDSFKILSAQCMNSNTTYSYLYEYLTEYNKETGGLPYYYKGNNAANIQQQIDLLNEHLPIVWHDKPVQDYVQKDNTLKSQSEKVEAVLDFLANVSLEPVNALVNTNSPFIDTLLAAVASVGETSEHTVSADIVLETVLSAAAPGQSSYGVTIQVTNKNGAVVNSYSEEAFRGQGKPVTPAEFNEMYEELLASVPNAKYYNVSFDLPTEDVILGEDPTILVATLSPLSYTVKIDGEADQTVYAFDAYTITLPGTGELGFKYIYDVAGRKVEVSTGSLENFSLGTAIEAIEALFGSDRELVITREMIDINRENLLKFVDNLNKAVVDAGLLSGNNLEFAFIPTEDAQGNLTIVLRISKRNAQLDLDAFLSEIVSLVNDLSYVGLNGSTLFGLNADNETKLYLQTLINFITNSGMGIDMIPSIITQNGDLVEMTLPENTVIGAVNNNIVLNGGIVNDVDQLGAMLIESTMQYGLSVNNCTSVPFYVTLQDFDKMSDVFAKVRKGATQILPYVNLTLKDGKVNATVNAPDSAYAYLLTALLVVGEIDFETLQTYDFAEVIDYVVGLIDPAFADESINADTFINTINNTGFYDAISDRFDFEAHKALINTIYRGADYAYDSIKVSGDSVGGLYEGVVEYNDLETIFNKSSSFALFKSMIAELDTGISTDFTFRLKNRDAKYQALVLDIHGNGIKNKYTLTKDIVSTVKNVKDNGIVVLLSDVRGNLVFNNDVILNLNGYSVNGNLVANGNVVIVDSTLSTEDCGSVTGTLTANAGGSFRIASGKFASDVSAFLDTGFIQKNGSVTNAFYKLVKNGNEINIYIGSSSVAADKASVKVMAADLVTKFVMNFYACSELKVNGNGIYGVDLKNVTESLDNLTVLLSKIVECIDCAGSSAFANELIGDITDFAAISDAIQNGTPVVSYTLTQSGFNPYLSVEGTGDDNYFAFNVNSSDNKKIHKLNLYVGEEVSEAHKDFACDILAELDKIITFNELKVDLTDISYVGTNGLKLSDFAIAGSAQADVVIDLTDNVNYPIILAAVLAKNATGAARDKYVNAIKDYQTSANTSLLMSVLEKATAAEIIAALKATKNMSFSAMLSSLGLNAPEAVNLEALYAIVRKLLGAVADRLDITGPSSALSGLKLDGVYGTYGFSFTRGASYAKVTLKVFTEDQYSIIVKNSAGEVVMAGDDLVDILNAVKDGNTVYINDNVVLTEDVTLPAVKFAIDKVEQIDFNGKKLSFTSGDTALTVDSDISSVVTADPSVFCFNVEYVMDGNRYVFSLNAQEHKWIPVAKVEPECGKVGYTAAEKCEHCGEYKDGKAPEEIPALEHIYVPTVHPADCFYGGYTEYVCSRNCGDSYIADETDPIDHKGHEKVLPAEPATKDRTGLTEGLKCELCETIIVEQEVLAKLPFIHVPTVTVDPVAGEIRGAKVDETNKVVYLDSDPTGLTATEFAKVFFKIDNYSDSKVTLKNADGTVVRGTNDLVCNGDTVTVWATNVDGVEVSVTYTVIIMGDTNCDGYVDVFDLSLTDAYVVGLAQMEGVSLLAADLNLDGEIDVFDLAACDYKVVFWAEQTYVSQTK